MSTGSTRLPWRSNQPRRRPRRTFFLLSLFLCALLFFPLRGPLRTWIRTYNQIPSGSFSPSAYHGCAPISALHQPREKGAILLLLREKDLAQLLPTLANFEEKFNAQFRYPYVMLSSPDEPSFSAHFRAQVALSLPDGAEVEYAEIEDHDWRIPDWLNATEMREGFARQGREGVQYSGREGYHHMCRFYSGLFARQKVLEKYEWYWRLEPGVRFYCRISYDPFRFLALRNQVYGFVITIVETPNTIPTLFRTLSTYATDHSLVPGALWPFFTKSKHGSMEGEYNMCHFWTNFEIGDLRFFRGHEYQDLFNMLDKKGGFYTERWGDAPVRSMALGMLVEPERVHYFEDFAYKHDWFMHCPPKEMGCECDCPAFGDGYTDIDRDGWYSCLPEWRGVQGEAKGGKGV
ncbi:nucleotide-diphospho-sugar transferase [Dacryopinax primogenitus]|uniref:Nucleotide-diphospho-sugar transferase n=1 Tax=Dacryopinax primogenitus (strain DJM 731) TaxID=1858805 RepID=M5G5B9_DACPD|nr:nucleotide-diphospho-sugar transferase [Dacryopinax primogenitus]EJU03430.1 nucleotide-diphospho-sugar transferase [Dacryopinax primogenitus]